MSEDARILSLRTVVRLSPGDANLRVLLSETLLKAGHAGDAEAEYMATRKLDVSRDDQNVVDRTIEEELRIAISWETGGLSSPIATKSRVTAAKRVKPTTREWFAILRNYALYSKGGGLDDDVHAYLDFR